MLFWDMGMWAFVKHHDPTRPPQGFLPPIAFLLAIKYCGLSRSIEISTLNTGYGSHRDPKSFHAILKNAQ